MDRKKEKEQKEKKMKKKEKRGFKTGLILRVD